MLPSTSDSLSPRAWGKLDRTAPNRASAARLSLVAHSIDVAAVARALIQLPTWRRRLETLAARPIGAVEIERMTVLAFLHDAGKASAGFFAKSLDDEAQARWRRGADVDARSQGHTRVVAALLDGSPNLGRHRAALGIDALSRWGARSPIDEEAWLDLWLAAVSHHGEPLALEHLVNEAECRRHRNTWTVRVGGYDPVEGLRELGCVARRLWPKAFTEAEDAPPPPQRLIHGFAGLVSLADWIASDIRFFPFDLGPDDHRRWEPASIAATRALTELRLDLEAARVDLRRRTPSFEDVFGNQAWPMQKACGNVTLRSPLILEAETGSGKTEAALWRFQALFALGEVDALTFLLPTRVAATSIARRVDEFVRRLFPQVDWRPSTVLAVPGYLRANGDDGKRLAPFTVLWPDHGESAPLHWAAENSKRFFAASVASATIDQFLLSTLQTKHAHLRASALLRSLVVVDEVHASDPYMRALLVKALERHLAAGGHAMLLSATLTRDLRHQLLRAAPQLGPKRMRNPWADAAASPEQSDASDPADDAYPLLSAPGHAEHLTPATSGKRITHSILPAMKDAALVAKLAADAVRTGARVLVLRNTVRQAMATQRALEEELGLDHPALFRCNGVVAMHHGRYALPDRRALDARVEELFGKSAATSTAAVVLCCTQTIEISVDCDADFLITDLAPMDVLLQRLGRLHRHPSRNAARPLHFAVPRCIVLVPEGGASDLTALLDARAARGLGLGERSAYPNLLSLQATLEALRDVTRFPALEIPSDNRILVERCCGLAALASLADRLGGAWRDHLHALAGKASAQGAHALHQCIDWARPWRDAVAGEMSPEARTRLGLDGIDLALPAGTRSPFGLSIDSISAPTWLLPPAPEDGGSNEPPTADEVFEEQSSFRFTVRGRGYRYTRLGLEQAAYPGEQP